MSLSHLCIVGPTKCGKSLLAKRLAGSIQRAAKVPVLVYDPTSPGTGANVNGWPGMVVDSWARFEASFWKSKSCLVVIDEAGEVSRDHRGEFRTMVQRGRHLRNGTGGHVIYMIGQRYVDLDKSARDMTSVLIAFRQSPSDADLLANEWICSDLLNCPRLPVIDKPRSTFSEYYMVKRSGHATLGRVRVPVA